MGLEKQERGSTGNRTSYILQRFAAIPPSPSPCPIWYSHPLFLRKSLPWQNVTRRSLHSTEMVDAKRNLKERVYSNRCYIWKQGWVFFGFFFFVFFLSQQSLFLIAADSFQHNTFHLQNSSQYLFNKHCIENKDMHSKATNNSEQKGVA